MAGSTFWGVGYAVDLGYVRAPRAVRGAAGALKPARTPVNARRGGEQGNDGGCKRQATTKPKDNIGFKKKRCPIKRTA